MSLDKVFRDLHAGPDLLILPNAWDAGSARVIEAAGAKAIATSSAAVAWGHGYPDGQFVPFDRMVASVEEMARIVRIPVSADIESGFGDSATAIEEPIARIVGAGAVGVNIEDGTGAPDLLCAKIERARKVAAKAGIDLWVNARIDVYIRKLAEGEAAFAESVRRAAVYKSAGADSIFVPALVDGPTIGRMVPLVGLPFNVLAWAGAPDAAELKRLGVRRLSAGAGLGRAAYDRTFVAAKAFLGSGSVEVLTHPEISLPNLNDLMRRT
jgi:2-methylisocitrate lyase-like PEP mutase family enzyme